VIPRARGACVLAESGTPESKVLGAITGLALRRFHGVAAEAQRQKRRRTVVEISGADQGPETGDWRFCFGLRRCGQNQSN
jgi:hypothetical protein